MIRRARTTTTALAAVAVVAVGLLVSCSEDDSTRRPINPSPTVADVVTTLAPPSPPPTTTVSVTTSTVIVDTTTSVTADSATTTTTSVASITPVTVVDLVRELVLLPDGVGGARFGAEAEGVISYISGIAGLPTMDSGWVDALESPFGACSSGRVRGVQWGQLQLLFGDESSVSTLPGHFFSYRYGGFTDQPPVPAGLKTVAGFALGSTLGQVRTVYPDVTVFEDPIFGAGFSISQGGISGTLTDASDTGQVTVLYGGIGCGE